MLETGIMFAGFLIASYSIVANDAIQTLGTFIASNSKRPWWVLWGFGGGILALVLLYGWWSYGGDVSYARLEKIPPPYHFTWLFLVPPIALLVLTRLGLPVSTTFLILTIFAQKNLWSMLQKSLMGYVVAFVVAILLYLVISHTLERHFLSTKSDKPSVTWVALQWASTGFLWSQWLIQDLANIFVYMPRVLPATYLIVCLFVMLGLHAYIFYSAGGAIQKIVTSKTNTTDIRSATIVDFTFGILLLFFKEYSKIPMSTTWVFLGLLAGREIAISIVASRGGWLSTGESGILPMRSTVGLIGRDAVKAGAGLAVSVVLALGLPSLAGLLPGADPNAGLLARVYIQLDDDAKEALPDKSEWREATLELSALEKGTHHRVRTEDLELNQWVAIGKRDPALLEVKAADTIILRARILTDDDEFVLNACSKHLDSKVTLSLDESECAP
jgi:hypothetical protein